MTALATKADWPVPAHVNAWVTERAGGVSKAAYSSLNLASHVGDDSLDVFENRRRLKYGLQLPDEPCWLEQVHGKAIANFDEAWSGAADGAVSTRAGFVCAVLTADCLPVLLTDRKGRRVGVAHAGWRGLARGVLASVVAAMKTPARDLTVWLGPAIGAQAYEVGDDVRNALIESDPRFSAAFAANERGRWQADLYALARLHLKALGVTEIYGGGLCTFSAADRFFSHRREAPCGRMATLIWLSS